VQSRSCQVSATASAEARSRITPEPVLGHSFVATVVTVARVLWSAARRLCGLGAPPYADGSINGIRARWTSRRPLHGATPRFSGAARGTGISFSRLLGCRYDRSGAGPRTTYDPASAIKLRVARSLVYLLTSNGCSRRPSVLTTIWQQIGSKSRKTALFACPTRLPGGL
jgi:hypothetical protein